MTRSFAEWDAHRRAARSRAAGLLDREDRRCAAAALPAGRPPASGVRVLDLTRVIAGPVCGRTLAAHGADVHAGHAAHLPQMMPLVMDNGRGKLSTFIDLRESSGRDALAALARDADVFVQGYRPGVVKGNGFGPDELARLRPGIVMCRSARTATKDCGRAGAASTRWCRTRTASIMRKPKRRPARSRSPCPARQSIMRAAT
jgi:crotonobetainyl-CoA:carnitine CoA-transferase CaiB-like acyl-CoA transferase